MQVTHGDLHPGRSSYRSWAHGQTICFPSTTPKPPHATLPPGAHGGRLDHILSNLGCLYRYRHLNLVLVGEGNITRLVPRGRSVVRPHADLEGPACGLVPLAGPARASTQGLKWDMGESGGGWVVEGEEAGSRLGHGLSMVL